MCIAQAERHIIIDQNLKSHASCRLHRVGVLYCRCMLTVLLSLNFFFLEEVRCTLYWWTDGIPLLDLLANLLNNFVANTRAILSVLNKSTNYSKLLTLPALKCSY